MTCLLVKQLQCILKSVFAEGWGLLHIYCPNGAKLCHCLENILHCGTTAGSFFPPLSALMTVFTVAVVICKLCAGGSVFYLGTNRGCLGISCYDCVSNGSKLTPRQLLRRSAAEASARHRLISLICSCFHEGPSHNPEGMQIWQETLQCEKYAATPYVAIPA